MEKQEERRNGQYMSSRYRLILQQGLQGQLRGRRARLLPDKGGKELECFHNDLNRGWMTNGLIREEVFPVM